MARTSARTASRQGAAVDGRNLIPLAPFSREEKREAEPHPLTCEEKGNSGNYGPVDGVVPGVVPGVTFGPPVGVGVKVAPGVKKVWFL